MSKIGLIAGGGDFPLILNKIISKHGDEVIGIGIKGHTDSDVAMQFKKLYWIELGELENLISAFHENNVTEVIMVGKVSKIAMFNNFVPDKRAMRILSSLKDRSDMSLLKAIVTELSSEGINLIHPSRYLSSLLATSGVLTKKAPSEGEWNDIFFGFPLIKKIADMDIGQSIVVKNKMVIAVEAIEGTDETIIRAGNVVKKDIIVIKVSRTHQDFRLDLPVVGPATIKALEKVKGSCLAVEAGFTVLLEKELLLKRANAANIAVVGINSSNALRTSMYD